MTGNKGPSSDRQDEHSQNKTCQNLLMNVKLVHLPKKSTNLTFISRF